MSEDECDRLEHLGWKLIGVTHNGWHVARPHDFAVLDKGRVCVLCRYGEGRRRSDP